jgi:hypothetical protein
MARTTLGTIPDFARRPTRVLVDSFKVATGRTPSGRYTGSTPGVPVRANGSASGETLS